MEEKCIVRTVSNLSYSGQLIKDVSLNTDAEGVFIRPSQNSQIMTWIPLNEIKSIIKFNGIEIKGEEIKNEIGLFKEISG